jgi:hypothetical protein
MNKFLSLVLLIFFTVSLQLPLSAVHAPGNTAVEVITQESQHLQSSMVAKGDKNKSARIRKVNRKSSRYQVGKFVSKLISGLSINKPPRKGKAPGSGMAIASLVLGILGILSIPYLVLSLLAIIFGAISLRRYNEGYHDRKGMAKAGLILGIIGAALTVLAIAVIVASF